MKPQGSHAPFLDEIMQYISFASGSSGNCALLRGGGVNLLIDAGISTKRIRTSLREFGLDLPDITGILVTHEHADHVAGLKVLTKNFPTRVYATRGTANALARTEACRTENLRVLPENAQLDLGELCIRTVVLSHDAAEPVGYRIEGEKSALAVLTDLGILTDAVLSAAKGCRFAVVETNHDIEMLKHGPYAPALKRRILSDRGHLCNEAGAELAQFLAENGAEEILLGHLSAENNTPGLARKAVEARVGRDLRISVAPRSTYSQEIIIE